jgi:zinc transport system substrate-binding protein
MRTKERTMKACQAVILAAVVCLWGCGGGEAPRDSVEQAPTTLSVFVVNYPLAYFAERIGGEHAEVTFPAPAGIDPAFWSPDAETVASYQAADLILLNGAGYAGWIELSSLAASKVVDTSASFASQYIPLEGTVTHSHGPAGDHEHGGWAFTTWLDPTLAIEHARAIHEAMVAARPQHAASFGEGFAGLVAELSALDQRFAAAAEAIGDEPLLFSHPVYQYLAGRYSLNGRSVHWEPDAAPDLSELEHLLEEQAAAWMLWEGEPLAETVAALEEYGIKSVVVEPCGNRPDTGDFMIVMAKNAAALESIAAE